MSGHKKKRREKNRKWYQEARGEFQETPGWGSMLEAATIRVPSIRIYDPKGQFPILIRTTTFVAYGFD